MDTSNYNQSLTTKLYVAAGVLFGTYGSRVCPMLETLTTLEIFTQVSIVFVLVWLTRHFLLAKHALVEQGRFAQLDTLLFFAASVPFALYYNLSYDFTIDSNLKVLFGMTLFGFFTGTILQLNAKLTQMDKMEASGEFDFQLIGERSSLVKQMIGLVIVLLVTLTTMLTMIAVKDIFWLEHNPDRLLDGTARSA